jgi:glycosyltransferase involved in cell wall biosynthesis
MPKTSDSIDVVMITKNSEKPLLNMCLKSIYANIPVNRLIVVDGYSTDETVPILKSYSNVEIVQMKGGRALARQRGIDEVETEWFAFVDSDVVLCKDWFDKIKSVIASNTGAVWGVAVPIAPSDLKRCTAVSKFYQKSLEDTMLIEGNRRGMLHDTIIHTDSVKDIIFPARLHVWEDQYVKQHITRKGLYWKATSRAYCHHYANLSARNMRELVEFGKIARAYGYYSWERVLLFTLLGLPKALWICALTRDFKIAKWQLDAYITIVAGWLAGGTENRFTES